MDVELVQHALRWLPFGGARPEDMFILFGLTPNDYRRRLATAVQRFGDALDQDIRQQLV